MIFKELLENIGLGLVGTAGIAFGIAVVIFFITIGWALIGWCIVAVVGLFTTVTVSGYFTYTAIGFVTHLIIRIIK